MNVSQAEKEIAQILANFERDSDCVVDTVTLSAIDITRMNDDRVQLGRFVKIETHRLPGNNWSQAEPATS